MTPEQEERLVVSFEDLSMALVAISQTVTKFADQMYPPRRPARDIEITHPLTA